MNRAKEKKTASAGDRLTVTLAAGHRRALEKIAKRNHATLAFVVRYALTEFIERHSGGQLNLAFPNLPP
jgi:hypothetical protein